LGWAFCVLGLAGYERQATGERHPKPRAGNSKSRFPPKFLR
jgi:hypothetical protein